MHGTMDTTATRPTAQTKDFSSHLRPPQLPPLVPQQETKATCEPYTQPDVATAGFATGFSRAPSNQKNTIGDSSKRDTVSAVASCRAPVLHNL
jgi:hypothetical protein